MEEKFALHNARVERFEERKGVIHWYFTVVARAIEKFIEIFEEPIHGELLLPKEIELELGKALNEMIDAREEMGSMKFPEGELSGMMNGQDSIKLIYDQLQIQSSIDARMIFWRLLNQLRGLADLYLFRKSFLKGVTAAYTKQMFEEVSEFLMGYFQKLEIISKLWRNLLGPEADDLIVTSEPYLFHGEMTGTTYEEDGERFIYEEEDGEIEKTYGPSYIAKGSYGVVIRAFNQNTKEKVAIKLFQDQGNDDPILSLTNFADAFADFKRERYFETLIQMQNINNPYVVRMLDYGVQENAFFIVYELADGDFEPAQLFGKKGFNFRLFLKLMEDTGRGLFAMHSAGVAHNDIKYANILLKRAPDGSIDRYMMGDIGAACGHAVQCIAFGTPGYVAPEFTKPGVFWADTTLEGNFQSDVYSLGAVWWGGVMNKTYFPIPYQEKIALQPPPMVQPSPLNPREEVWKGIVNKIISSLSQSPHGAYPFVPPMPPPIPSFMPSRAPPRPTPGQIISSIAEKVVSILRSMLQVEPQLRPSAENVLRELLQVRKFYSVIDGYSF